MNLNPIAIAMQGMGFGPLLMAVQGLLGVEEVAEIVPARPHARITFEMHVPRWTYAERKRRREDDAVILGEMCLA